MKLIRRSIAQLLRDAGTPRAWSEEWRDPARKVPTEQIEVQLGHRVIDSVTDLYSAFDPDYQHAATAALTAIIDAIIERCPAAFSAPSPEPPTRTDPTRPTKASDTHVRHSTPKRIAVRRRDRHWRQRRHSHPYVVADCFAAGCTDPTRRA